MRPRRMAVKTVRIPGFSNLKELHSYRDETQVLVVVYREPSPFDSQHIQKEDQSRDEHGVLFEI
jgi:heme-degrading monooxygenase HmoA